MSAQLKVSATNFPSSCPPSRKTEEFSVIFNLHYIISRSTLRDRTWRVAVATKHVIVLAEQVVDVEAPGWNATLKTLFTEKGSRRQAEA